MTHVLEDSVPASLATYLRTAVSVLQDTTRLPMTLAKVSTDLNALMGYILACLYRTRM